MEHEVIHTTLTDQLAESQEEAKNYKFGFVIAMTILVLIFVFNGLAFLVSLRTVMTYQAVCPEPNYNLCLPTPVPTPTKL